MQLKHATAVERLVCALNWCLLKFESKKLVKYYALYPLC